MELIEFVSRITMICQLELIGFANWIRHFLPRIAAVFRGFTKIKNECRRQSQQNIVFNPEQVQVNVDSPFNALLGSIKLVL